ncbi:hypothetical protein AMTR_s00007p00059760 [Amborella trichopoda]|uniref:Protein kinase domain-containing protein n=1 Tax=Amborella trichopoda TaxID=13333 RepID=W1PDV0_AMBTC|nr:hypothetical protein AMTR_s00007p00059760 [Amborella trichopoda]
MAAPLPIKDWIRLKTIGNGSYGCVSLARNLEDGHLFAVLKNLDSPFIANCLGQCYDEEGRVNIFTEYMEGGDLSSLSMSCKGLPEIAIKAYTNSMLRGLQYLHGNGIIQCDIKAKNVLLGCLGEVKLADFGAAKRVPSELLDIHPGTLGWMAPEIFRKGEQGMPSDIWSLGSTVVEMATGKVPELSPKILKLTGISDCSLDFLEKCFMREPSERWTAPQLLHHPFLASAHSNVTLFSPTTVLDNLWSPQRKEWTDALTSSRGFDKHQRCITLTSYNDFDEEQTIDTLKSYRASQAMQRIKTPPPNKLQRF